MTHGAEHIIALFFSDLAKDPLVRQMNEVYSILYHWFGGAHHSVHAIFAKYCRLHNDDKKCGLIKPADKRMAGYIRDFLCMARLKPVCMSMLADPEYVSLKIDPRVTRLIQSEVFWNVNFELCQAAYPGLRLLRICDQRMPAMDQLYYFVRQMDTRADAGEETLNRMDCSNYDGIDERFTTSDCCC